MPNGGFGPPFGPGIDKIAADIGDAVLKELKSQFSDEISANKDAKAQLEKIALGVAAGVKPLIEAITMHMNVDVTPALTGGIGGAPPGPTVFAMLGTPPGAPKIS